MIGFIGINHHAHQHAHPPRVLLVDQTGQLGGAELSLLDVARRVGERGKVVVFEDGPFVERLREAGVEVEVLTAGAGVRHVKKDAGWFAQVKALGGLGVLTWRLARRAKRWRAEVIYANTQKALVVAALASVLSRRPLVYHLRDMLTASHFSRANRRLVVALANRLATRVIANSVATRDAFVQAGGDPNRTRVIPNGINPTPFDQVDDEQVVNLRRELGIDDHPVIGIFGRLAHWKGQHVLIDALSQLQALNTKALAGVGSDAASVTDTDRGLANDEIDPTHAHALLVGDALFGEHDYAHRLQAQVEQHSLTDHVHFLGFRDDIPMLMKACEVVVHCSVSPEPFGRVIVEAMLAGRPVIATAAGGANEILNQADDPADSPGILIAPNDADGLAKTIDHLLTHPHEATAMAKRGQTRARQRYSLAHILDEIETVIAEARGCLAPSRG